MCMQWSRVVGEAILVLKLFWYAVTKLGLMEKPYQCEISKFLVYHVLLFRQGKSNAIEL